MLAPASILRPFEVIVWGANKDRPLYRMHVQALTEDEAKTDVLRQYRRTCSITGVSAHISRSFALTYATACASRQPSGSAVCLKIWPMFVLTRPSDGIVMEIDLVATVVAPRWIADISPPCNDNGSKPSLRYSPPIFHCEPFECSEIRGVRFGA